MRAARSGILVGLLLWLALPSVAVAQGRICVHNFRPTPTLREDAAQSELILFCHPANPRDLGDGKGLTDLVVLRVLKGGDLLAGKKMVGLDRLVVPAPGTSPHLMAFGERDKEKL